MSCKSTIIATTTITAYTPNLVRSAWQSDRVVVIPAAETTLALGYGIEVRWQSSDLSVFAGAVRTGSSSSSGSSSTHSPTTTPTPTPLTTSTADTSTPAISPSTKLALGLGIPIVVILLGLILVALYLIRRRRRQKHNHEPPKPYPILDTPPAPAELQGDSTMIEPKPYKVELSARTPSPVEIDGTRVIMDQRVSGTYTISPVGTHFTNPDDIRVRRSPIAAEAHNYQHRRSESGSVARTPSSARRLSDDRVPPIRRPVPVRKGTTPENSMGGSSGSGGASEEEREIAERYRMFTTL